MKNSFLVEYETNLIENSKKIGIDEGMEKGMEKGIEKGIKKTAEKMIKKGMNNQIINEFTEWCCPLFKFNLMFGLSLM